MRREKPGRESVANVEKLWYPFLPPANVQILRIGKVESDPYFSDEKSISLNAPIDRIGVLASRIGQFQLTKKLAKEPIKQILRQHIEGKKEYATPKNVWFDK